MSKTLAVAMNRVRNIIKEPWHSLSSYSTGTVTVVNASATVTGSGTLWTTNAKAGETFHIAAGRYYTILAIASDTSLTLTETYAGTGAAGASYTIRGGNRTDAVLVEDINSAQHEIVNALEEADENYLVTTGTISYVATTERYALPTTNGVVRRVLLVERTDLSETKILHPIPVQQKKKYSATSATTNVDNLNEYYYIWGDYIGIIPKPTTTATNNITIHYAPEATDLTVDTSTFVIPDRLYDLLCYTAAMKSTDDPVIAQAQARLWAQMITTRSGRIMQESRSVINLDNDNY